MLAVLPSRLRAAALTLVEAEARVDSRSACSRERAARLHDDGTDWSLARGEVRAAGRAHARRAKLRSRWRHVCARATGQSAASALAKLRDVPSSGATDLRVQISARTGARPRARRSPH